MNDSDRAAFAQAIGDLALGFSNTKWSADHVRLYWNHLQPFPLAKVLKAIAEQASSDREFMPPPGVLASMCKPDPVADKQRAGEAWAECRELMKDSRNAKAKCADPVANEAVRIIGGWQTLAQRDEDEVDAFYRGRFVEAYEQILQSSSAPVDRLEYRDPEAQERISSGIAGLLKH